MKQQSLFADADTVGSPLFSVPAEPPPPAAWQTPRQQQALPVPPAGAYLRKGTVQKLEDEGFELAAKMDWTAALLNALGNPSEWESEGTVYDAGERSQQRCACDHPIRNEISMALVAAENALLDWAYETMMRLHPERADVLRLTLGNDTVTGRRHLGRRHAMLDTASRLVV